MAGNQDNQRGKQGGIGTKTGTDKDRMSDQGRQGGQRGKDMSGDNKPERSTDMDQQGRQGGGKADQKR
ncbi:MAG: hypothetical protein LBJ37_01695 [Paucimonas sp.]|nr:hypothetical protein [Paucimonas sp.]